MAVLDGGRRALRDELERIPLSELQRRIDAGEVVRVQQDLVTVSGRGAVPQVGEVLVDPKGPGTYLDIVYQLELTMPSRLDDSPTWMVEGVLYRETFLRL